MPPGGGEENASGRVSIRSGNSEVMRAGCRQSFCRRKESAMSNLREQLISNNRFLVSMDAMLFSFSKVTNISDTVETEVIQEGGSNWAPELLLKPKTKAETLVLERGVQTGAASRISEKALALGNRVLVATIIVLDQGRSVSKVYGFEQGLITKWEVSSLDAMGNELLIRRLEISHNGLVEL